MKWPSGFGRTGKMFACEHEDVEPDLMCVAKGITGGYLPLAATFATQKIFDAFLGEPWEGKTFFHGHTYTGNPLACAAALASLDLFEKHDLVDSVAAKIGTACTDARNSFAASPRRRHPAEGIYGRHRVGGGQRIDEAVRSASSRSARKSAQRIRRHGVILRPLGDVIVLMPPLAMELDDLKRIVAAVAEEVRRIKV